MKYKSLMIAVLIAGILNGCSNFDFLSFVTSDHQDAATQTNSGHHTGTTAGGTSGDIDTANHDDEETTPEHPRIYADYNASQDIARLYGKATQGTGSGYQYYEPASNAIDGDETTYNHTSGLDKNNWLQIALPKGTRIARIVITSRKGHNDRIAGAKVYLSNTSYSGKLDGELVATLKGTSDPQEIVIDPQKQKEYLLIKAVAGKPLHLTSVNIFGTLLENPAIIDYKKHVLINYDTPVGKQITAVEAKDMQGDTLRYTLNEGVPFRIDSNGNIFVAGTLKADMLYRLTVTVSDGKSAASAQIDVQTTAADALKHALETGDASGVTKAILMEAFDKEITQHHAGDADYATIKKAVDALYNDTIRVNFSACSSDYKGIGRVPKDGKCISNNAFIDAMPMIHKKLAALDKTKTAFKDIDDTTLKLLILLGDKYRQEISFDGNPSERGNKMFFHSTFADYTVYCFRDYNPAQPDMGNYSRSRFPGVARIDKRITRTSRPPFRSTGLYAFPGETFSVTRTDTNSATYTSVFIATLRPDATNMFHKYRRPRFLKSVNYPIAPGETLRITSPYGGPIEIGFRRGSATQVAFSFKHVGEHPYWRSSADDAKFQKALDANRFDWAELSTPGFEVHSKIEKMKESIKAWAEQNADTPKTDKYSAATASNLANATIHFTSNYPFGLAGFKSSSIDPIDEIDRFAEENGLTMRTIDFVKHMNADQAACGYGCSGNPYDAFWAFSPTAHGDIHEIGHSLQSGTFLLQIDDFKWGVHAATNPYAFYTKSRYHMETGGDPNCQGFPFKNAFKQLNDAAASGNIKQYMHDHYWVGSGYGEQFLMMLQSMMSVQQMGKDGTITGDHRIEFGWHLLGRVHVLLREFKASLINDTAWADKKDALGFGNYTRAEAKRLSNNDIMIILYSKAAYADFRDYWDMWGVPYSTKASNQVASFGYPKVPRRFFLSTPNARGMSKGFCTEDSFTPDGAANPLEKEFLPVDGKTKWPEE